MNPRQARERPRHWHAPSGSWLVLPTRNLVNGRSTDYADAEHLVAPRTWSWGRFTFILIIEGRAERPSPVPEADVVAYLRPGRRPPGARTYDVEDLTEELPPDDEGDPPLDPLVHDPREPF